MDFFPNDSTFAQNMTNAFSFQIEFDTTGASYFYLALFNNSIEKAYKHIKKYIYHQPSDISGILQYANLLFNNEIYGLTKGQASPASRSGTVSPSTPDGSHESPLSA